MEKKDPGRVFCSDRLYQDDAGAGWDVKNKNDCAIQFLGDAGKILSESLDYETILKATAVLLLDFLADVCFIDLIEENELGSSFSRVVSMAKDVSLDKVADAAKKYSLYGESDPLIANILRHHQGRLVDNFCDELKKNKANADYIQLLEKLGCGSALIMPLESHDKIFGVLTSVRAISENKFSKTDSDLIAEFARRAAMAIENARLYRQAQLAVDAKNQFLANMSHEIRTPLGVILGFVELLKTRELPYDKQKYYLDVITRNGEQLLGLVGDLLDLSRVDLGKIDINPVSLSLLDLLDEVTMAFSMKAAEKKLKISIDYDKAVPKKIISDPLRIRQVLVNLLSNAIKFSSDSVIQVSVKAVPIGGEFGIEIRVADQGIGIDPEQHSKLFQLFSQADNTMTRKFGGVGLGLYLSRKIALALGGNVELLSSGRGKGAVFLFSFVAAPSESRLVADVREQEVTRIQPDLIKKKVLVVEDSEDNQFLIARFLENENVEIDIAENGKIALEKAQKNKYDLILMDIQMPVMDGYTATVRLRQMGVYVPIIAITAHAMASDRAHCREVGCNSYLTKPLNRDSLRNAVRSFL